MSCTLNVSCGFKGSEDLKDYLEKYGFEVFVTDKVTDESFDYEEDRDILRTFPSKFIVHFIYDGDKLPLPRVFKKIFQEKDTLEDFVFSLDIF